MVLHFYVLDFNENCFQELKPVLNLVKFILTFRPGVLLDITQVDGLVSCNEIVLLLFPKVLHRLVPSEKLRFQYYVIYEWSLPYHL